MAVDANARPVAVQAGRVTTEGDELYYEVRGQGQPLIMIPGARGNAVVYSLVADLLCDEYKVITYDRRANARSTMNEPINFEISQQSRDVVAVIKAAGETSAFVFGNSSGAVIALDVAKTQPKAAKAVIAHEPPLARVHPNAKKWQRFYANVYLTAFNAGSGLALLQFLIGTGLPVRQMIKANTAAREAEDRRNAGNPPAARIADRDISDILAKHELLPVTNYLPDVAGIMQNEVKMFMAAGLQSLEKRRWYAETAVILAKQLKCEMVAFPGHHSSFLDMPEVWAATLRSVLQRADQ